jgi:outer membrane biosynthesis protein TonB
MAQKQLRGVSGVLGNLISEPEAPPTTPPEEKPHESKDVLREQGREHPEEQQPPEPRESSAVEKKEAKPRKKEGARRGRPPAVTRTSELVEREKVSLRLRADLAATYRDWSWEEHCQFSELVDRAMEFYLKSRGKARKPERE